MRRLHLPMPLLLSGVVTATTALALSVTGTGCNSGTDPTSTQGCVSTPEFFARQIQARILSPTCSACHNPIGQANTTKFVLHSSAEAGYLDANMEVVKNIAQTEKNGLSILLQKPLGQLQHGGGKVLDPGSQEYADLKTLVDKFNSSDNCPTNSAQFFAGAQLASPVDTLRKATLVLGARLPTDAEIGSVTTGGFPALNTILDELLTEEAFYDRLRESYNDRFFTDFYMDDSNNPLDLIQADTKNPATQYYRPNWFDAIAHDDGHGNISATVADMVKYGAQSPDDLRRIVEGRTRQAVAQEPLELIAHIVRNNKPFTEVLTADYTVVNPYSAKAYSVTKVQFANDIDPYEFHEAKVADGGAFPQAGVLSMPVWLSRHPTTATNRNRHRSRMVFQDWLGTDILKTAERPLDPTKIKTFNPTLNDSNCAVCHANVDPIAGLFQNFQHEQGNQSAYIADFKWYMDMRPPGFGATPLPPDQYPNSLAWLGQQVTADPRFSIAVTYQAFRMLTGQEPLTAPADPSSPTFKDDFDAYLGEYYTLGDIAQKFKGSNYNFKVLVKDIVMSPYFRAQNTASDINPAQTKKFGPLGGAHLLTPEQLNRKISNVLGIDWRNDLQSPFDLLDMNQYRLLYGGIDSANVTKRMTDPNGIIANVSQRMANEMSCTWVPAEFVIADKTQRKFFTMVDATLEPQDVNGYDVPEAKAAILSQIQLLHEKFLGEKLDVTDPQIQTTYNLFVSVWKDGKTNLAKKTAGYDIGLPGDCKAAIGANYITGAPIADPMMTNGDDKLYTIRAWMAVSAYLMTDYKFLYE